MYEIYIVITAKAIKTKIEKVIPTDLKNVLNDYSFWEQPAP
jgi:hypothetical protein